MDFLQDTDFRSTPWKSSHGFTIVHEYHVFSSLVTICIIILITIILYKKNIKVAVAKQWLICDNYDVKYKKTGTLVKTWLVFIR